MKALAISLFLFSGFAQAMTVDFEDVALTVPGLSGDLWPSFSSGGADFSFSGISAFLGRDLTTAFNGTTFLAVSSASWSVPGPVSMSMSDSSLFGLTSLEVAELGATPTIIITGYKLGGDTVTSVVTLDGISDGAGVLPDFEVISFDNSWINLERVEISGVGRTAWAMDNISVVAIPIPASIWFLCSALALLGLRKKVAP